MGKCRSRLKKWGKQSKDMKLKMNRLSLPQSVSHNCRIMKVRTKEDNRADYLGFCIRSRKEAMRRFSWLKNLSTQFVKNWINENSYLGHDFLNILISYINATQFLNSFENIIIVIKWGVELPQTKTLPTLRWLSLKAVSDTSAKNNWGRALTEKSLNASTPKTISNMRWKW